MIWYGLSSDLGTADKIIAFKVLLVRQPQTSENLGNTLLKIRRKMQSVLMTTLTMFLGFGKGKIEN